MHPPLNAGHQHAKCAETMQALIDCHESNPYLKFVGVCNSQKQALNLCFRAERLEKANDNLEKAKQKRKLIEGKWKEIELEQ